MSRVEQQKSVVLPLALGYGDGGGLQPISLLHENLSVAAAGCGGGGFHVVGRIRVTNEALTALNSLTGFEGHPGDPGNQLQKEVRVRCLALASRWRPGADGPSWSEGDLSPLLRGKTVSGDDDPSNTLVPVNTDLVSVPEDLDDAPELLEVLPQVSRRSLEADQERMQLEHGCEDLDPAFKHNRWRALVVPGNR